MTTTQTQKIEHANVIDLRDLVQRYDELAGEIEEREEDWQPEGLVDHDAQELADLEDVFRQFCEQMGMGGGLPRNWVSEYAEDTEPTIVAASFFVDYIKELVEDCYWEEMAALKAMKSIGQYVTIDWEALADDWDADYNDLTLDGVDYKIRAN